MTQNSQREREILKTVIKPSSIRCHFIHTKVINKWCGVACLYASIWLSISLMRVSLICIAIELSNVRCHSNQVCIDVGAATAVVLLLSVLRVLARFHWISLTSIYTVSSAIKYWNKLRFENQIANYTFDTSFNYAFSISHLSIYPIFAISFTRCRYLSIEIFMVSSMNRRYRFWFCFVALSLSRCCELINWFHYIVSDIFVLFPSPRLFFARSLHSSQSIFSLLFHPIQLFQCVALIDTFVRQFSGTVSELFTFKFLVFFLVLCNEKSCTLSPYQCVFSRKYYVRMEKKEKANFSYRRLPHIAHNSLPKEPHQMVQTMSCSTFNLICHCWIIVFNRYFPISGSMFRLHDLHSIRHWRKRAAIQNHTVAHAFGVCFSLKTQ